MQKKKKFCCKLHLVSLRKPLPLVGSSPHGIYKVLIIKLHSNGRSYSIISNTKHIPVSKIGTTCKWKIHGTSTGEQDFTAHCQTLFLRTIS